jgi:transcriptional regulator with XRE-family HTH domain
MTIVSERLKKTREDKGLSLMEVARKVDVFYKRIEEYENNIKVPDIGHAYKLTKGYGITLCYLVGNTDDPMEVVDVSEKSGKAQFIEDDDFSEEDKYLIRRSLSEPIHYLEWWYKNKQEDDENV